MLNLEMKERFADWKWLRCLTFLRWTVGTFCQPRARWSSFLPTCLTSGWTKFPSSSGMEDHCGNSTLQHFEGFFIVLLEAPARACTVLPTPNNGLILFPFSAVKCCEDRSVGPGCAKATHAGRMVAWELPSEDLCHVQRVATGESQGCGSKLFQLWLQQSKPGNPGENYCFEGSKYLTSTLENTFSTVLGPHFCGFVVLSSASTLTMPCCLRWRQASDVADADVVICSYRLLYSQIYLKRRQEKIFWAFPVRSEDGLLWDDPDMGNHLETGRSHQTSIFFRDDFLSRWSRLITEYGWIVMGLPSHWPAISTLPGDHQQQFSSIPPAGKSEWPDAGCGA